MFDKILLCLDGSELAEQVLPYATEQALRFDSKVLLLQVMKISTADYMAEGVVHSGTMSAQSRDSIEEEIILQETDVRTYLDSIAETFRARGIDVECVILRPASTAEAITKFAHENDIDLICMATHGRSGFKRAVIGSVADQVLREAKLPVLMIKPKD